MIPQNQPSSFRDAIVLPPSSFCLDLGLDPPCPWGEGTSVSLLPPGVTKHNWWDRSQIPPLAKESHFWRWHCFPSSCKAQSNGSSSVPRQCWLPKWTYERFTECLEMTYETISSTRKCHGMVGSTLPSGDAPGQPQLAHLDGGCWVLASSHYHQSEDLGTKHSSRKVAMPLHLPKHQVVVQ